MKFIIFLYLIIASLWKHNCAEEIKSQNPDIVFRVLEENQQRINVMIMNYQKAVNGARVEIYRKVEKNMSTLYSQNYLYEENFLDTEQGEELAYQHYKFASCFKIAEVEWKTQESVRSDLKTREIFQKLYDSENTYDQKGLNEVRHLLNTNANYLKRAYGCMEKKTGSLMGDVGTWSCLRMVHPGAVYLKHSTIGKMVKRLDKLIENFVKENDVDVIVERETKDFYAKRRNDFEAIQWELQECVKEPIYLPKMELRIHN